MTVEEQVPANRRTIMTVAFVLLCAAAVAYSQGWLSWSNPSYEGEGNNTGTEQSIDREKTNKDANDGTQQTTTPAATLTEQAKKDNVEF
jgi:hypothetical protein